METITQTAAGMPVPGLSRAGNEIKSFAKSASRQISEIIVHCSATPAGRNVRCSEIRRWHMADRGFSDIGYHFVIDLDGTVETGRPLSQLGAHCVGHNRKSIGICYIGGVDHKGNASDTRTISQKEALTRLILIIKQAFPNVRVHGHRDFARKECPSFDAASEYAGLTVHDFSRKR